jgi:hypothetical protein
VISFVIPAHDEGLLLGLLARLALAGPESVRQRKGLELWYGERRTEPESAVPVVRREAGDPV